MKKLIVLFLLLAPFLALAESGVPVSVNGGNTTLYSTDDAGAGVSINAPNATGFVQSITAHKTRSKFDGTGSWFFPTSNPAAGTAATTVATDGTIDTTIFWQRVTDAGAITGVILEAGTSHGQVVLVTVDKDASGSVTMAAEATSNVCSGTSAVLAAGEGALFVWDATDTCWAEFGT